MFSLKKATQAEIAAFEAGYRDGAQSAIDACFGGGRYRGDYDTPEESDAYSEGWDAGKESID